MRYMKLNLLKCLLYVTLFHGVINSTSYTMDNNNINSINFLDNNKYFNNNILDYNKNLKQKYNNVLEMLSKNKVDIRDYKIFVQIFDNSDDILKPKIQDLCNSLDWLFQTLDNNIDKAMLNIQKLQEQYVQQYNNYNTKLFEQVFKCEQLVLNDFNTIYTAWDICSSSINNVIHEYCFYRVLPKYYNRLKEDLLFKIPISNRNDDVNTIIEFLHNKVKRIQEINKIINDKLSDCKKKYIQNNYHQKLIAYMTEVDKYTLFVKDVNKTVDSFELFQSVQIQ